MRISARLISSTLILMMIGMAGHAYAAPVPLQVNNFESGTTMAWGEGLPAADPMNINSGGPGGASDNYLRVSATGGGGAGSRLIILNRALQWRGSYAGIPAIEMDLKHLGVAPQSTAPLSMRIALMSGSNYAVTTAPHMLPADGQWHHVSFPLTTSAMTASGASLASILSNVTEFRILHSVGADYRGDTINTAFGLDNVVAVPEPSVLLLMAASGLLMIRRRQ